MYREQLEQLMALPVSTIRSADRASIKAMLTNVKRNQALSYQELQNLWAYCNRYGVAVMMNIGH